ncbi:MAG: AraC family transcriptional regulator [Pseudomonadales bacterium]|nr:AraC family transcriptional regulator [Pseudomonadales bacterium]
MTILNTLASEFFSQAALIGASQGLTLAIVISSIKRENRLANVLLTAFILIATIRLFLLYLLHSGKFIQTPEIFTLLSLSFAVGPLLYFYVLALSHQSLRLGLKHYLQFLPVPLCIFISLGPGFSEGRQMDLENWFNRGESIMNFHLDIILPLLSASWLMLYAVLAGRCLYAHDFTIRQYFSSLEHKTLQWLWVVIGLCFLAGFLEICLQLLPILFDIELAGRLRITLIFNVITMFIIAIMGLKQPVIFSHPEAAEEAAVEAKEVSASMLPVVVPDQDAKADGKQRYKKSGLNTCKLDIIWLKLQQLMHDKKPYLSCTINLRDLAQELNVSHNYLTEVINRQSGSNFFDFINHFRVDFAKQLLSCEKPLPLLDVALESGFSSQSAFSTRFKKVTGLTPSQFLRQQETK